MWIVSALLFVTAAIIFLLKKIYWWTIAIPATIISQFAILGSWGDAKFGTIANAFIAAAIIFGWGDSSPASAANAPTENPKKDRILSAGA